MPLASDHSAVTLPFTSAARTPDDLLITILQQQKLLDEQADTDKKKSRVIDQKSRKIESLEKYIDELEQRLRLSTHQRYGRSSEANVLQERLDLDDEFADDEANLANANQSDSEEAAEKKPSKKRRRKGFSPTLPRKRVEILLSDEERARAQSTFFTKVKEELDIIPAQVQVLEIWQEKAIHIDAQGERHICAAARAPHPIGKGVASINLLAWLIVAKVADGLPLNRIANILKRYGGEMDRTTLAQWVISLHLKMGPLLQCLEKHLLSNDYIQGDETRLQVLKEPGLSATGHKWLWIMRGGPPGRIVVMFNYDKSRGGDVAKRLLKHFKGRYFQSDGYAGYDAVCKMLQVVHLGCMDHARRKVVEAIKAHGPWRVWLNFNVNGLRLV